MPSQRRKRTRGGTGNLNIFKCWFCQMKRLGKYIFTGTSRTVPTTHTGCLLPACRQPTHSHSPLKIHEENLATICCVCGRKGKYQNVSNDLAASVKQNSRLSAPPPTCRNAWREMKKDPEQSCQAISSNTLPSDPPESPPELRPALAVAAASV